MKRGFGLGGGISGAGGGQLTSEIEATLAVGGIGVGDTFPTGTVIQNIISDLIAPYVAPTLSGLAISLSVADTYIEIGRTLDVNSASWAIVNDSEGNPPQNMYITGDGFNKAVTGTSATANPASTTTRNTAGSNSWVLSGEDKDATVITPSTYSKAWRFRYWLGATNSADPTDAASATILALALQQSQLLAAKTASFTCTADNNTAGNYTWIAYLASYGALSNIIQNGALSVLTAFTYIGAFDVTNAYGIVASYRFYKSNADGAFADGTTLAIT